MRPIKRIHPADYRPIADLITYSPMPSYQLQQVDPFIFLNHHGFQTYKPNNQGLPFGPHPHRGMETVTFILEGDIMHQDSGGHQSVIEAGGIQWMTAGSGLIHAEVSSDKFKKEGGDLEILQLWVNLPAKLKMTKPRYIGKQKSEMNHLQVNEKVSAQVIAGGWEDVAGSFETLFPISLHTVTMQQGGSFEKVIPAEENIFFYVVRGKVKVSGEDVSFRNLVEFKNEGETLAVEALEDSIILLGHAKPHNEPMVSSRLTFVMNTREEIMQAYQDYQDGKFGSWD